MINDFKVVMLDVNKIKRAPYQPEIREKKGNLRELLAGVQKYGILIPISVTPSYQIIDGHRRLACAFIEEIPEIPVFIFRAGPKVLRELFPVLNQNRKYTTREELQAWIKGGPVTAGTETEINELKRLIGMRGIQIAAEKKLSAHSLIGILNSLKFNVGDMPSAFWKDAMLWMIVHNQQRAIKDAITNRTDKKIIIGAIKANTPIE